MLWVSAYETIVQNNSESTSGLQEIICVDLSYARNFVVSMGFAHYGPSRLFPNTLLQLAKWQRLFRIWLAYSATERVYSEIREPKIDCWKGVLERYMRSWECSETTLAGNKQPPGQDLEKTFAGLSKDLNARETISTPKCLWMTPKIFRQGEVPHRIGVVYGFSFQFLCFHGIADQAGLGDPSKTRTSALLSHKRPLSLSFVHCVFVFSLVSAVLSYSRSECSELRKGNVP